MKGYKAFHKGLTAYGGFKYEIGKEYEITGELKMCENGFHFCVNLIDVFGYYEFNEKTVELAEVEASGKIIQEGTKFCAEKIKIIEMIPWENVLNAIKDDNCNSGNCNSGSFNSGSSNSGSYNSGSFNSGSYNSGSSNSGSFNSGSYNSGSRNSGSSNSGSFNSGFFNSSTPTVRLFNKDSGLTFGEFYKLGIDFNDLDESKSIIQALPNYDAQVFFEATGIDWRDKET